MQPVPAGVAVLALATASVLVVTRLGYRPGEARTHLYETEAGERANPLAAFAAGAARSGEVCDGCGRAEVPREARYCVDCLGDD